MSQRLHETIGDYLREIDKIKKRERLSERKKITRIALWRKKIRLISERLLHGY